MNNLKNEILRKASTVGEGEKFLAIILGEKLSEECCFLMKMHKDGKQREKISIFYSEKKSLAVLYIKDSFENTEDMNPYFEFLSEKNIVSSSIYAYTKDFELLELELTESFILTEDLKEKICF